MRRDQGGLRKIINFNPMITQSRHLVVSFDRLLCAYRVTTVKPFFILLYLVYLHIIPSYEAWFEHQKKLVEKIIWISTNKYITYICLWSFAIMKGFDVFSQTSCLNKWFSTRVVSLMSDVRRTRISSEDHMAILLNKIRHMISDDASNDLSVD